MRNNIKKLWDKYVHLLKTYPATTKTLTGAFFVGLGDAVAQKFIENRSFKDGTFDTTRTLRFAGVALLFITPTTRAWIDVILPRYIKPINSSNKTIFALKKVFADATIFSPVICCMVLGLNMWFTFQYTPGQVCQSLKERVPGVVFASWAWWPVNQFINFRFVPLHFQHNYIMAAAFVWNTYLSWRMNKEMREREEQDEDIDKKLQ